MAYDKQLLLTIMTTEMSARDHLVRKWQDTNKRALSDFQTLLVDPSLFDATMQRLFVDERHNYRHYFNVIKQYDTREIIAELGKLTSKSRLYLDLHGKEGTSDLFNQNHGKAGTGYQWGYIVGMYLTDSSHYSKTAKESSTNRLKIVFSICYGANYAEEFLEGLMAARMELSLPMIYVLVVARYEKLIYNTELNTKRVELSHPFNPAQVQHIHASTGKGLKQIDKRLKELDADAPSFEAMYKEFDESSYNKLRHPYSFFKRVGYKKYAFFNTDQGAIERKEIAQNPAKKFL
ncbi:hypothetical protein [Stigmatella erecta]|uniref:Uncharacterized protein n=1 Tax=Stigmatella erecta TaxID=83460 RepID=A0A1I0HSE1_9BACT|nr:hypothetical protein [Stigmatella erecta]SET86723.1 hypothetical protein SAMN05443639_10579 [Stigmatella erecta]